MVAFRAYRQRQSAAMIAARTEPVDQTSEIVARLPAKLRPGPRVVVDALYGGKHRPAKRGIDFRVVGHIARDHGGSVLV